MTIDDDLTLDELTLFQRLGPDRYQAAVIGLFMSGRATPEHWRALGEAVLHVSESSTGHLVLPIDRAILRQLQAVAAAAPARSP